MDCIYIIENPDTNDHTILSCVCLDIYKEYFDEETFEEERESKKNQYRRVFNEINYLCRKNHSKEFFTNPKDIAASEKERKDLVAFYSEEELNAFFGVESFYDYKPPYLEYPEEE